MPNQLSFFDPPPPQYHSLSEVETACRSCTRCRLSVGRTQVVFGAGNPQANLMLVGQGPSQSDDASGLPYTGPSGEVLDKALAEVGLNRADIWLTNVHKCLSYDHKNHKLRPPRADEVSACRPWLRHEIEYVQPKAIVCLGGPAAQVLIDPSFKLSEQRGQWFPGQLGGVQTLATFQPAYLMRLKQWDPPAALEGWQALLADLHMAVEACTPNL